MWVAFAPLVPAADNPGREGGPKASRAANCLRRRAVIIILRDTDAPAKIGARFPIREARLAIFSEMSASHRRFFFVTTGTEVPQFIFKERGKSLPSAALGLGAMSDERPERRPCALRPWIRCAEISRDRC